MTNKDMFKSSHYNSLEDQIGGKHYRSMKIQPAEFINENKLLFPPKNYGNKLTKKCFFLHKNGNTVKPRNSEIGRAHVLTPVT